jgi:membrane-bound serine protease (ClpP class)
MPPMLRAIVRWIAALCMVAGAAGLFGASSAHGAAGEVHVLTLDDVIINPISARYIVRGIEEGAGVGAEAVVIELNTPGGLLDATEDITGAMLDAAVPVVVYVTAMAPSTRMGAATPVSGDGTEIPEDLRNKIISDTVAYARIIAEERGRNADWAEDAVRPPAVVATADEAVELNVVDVVAESRAALLEEIDGRTVEIRGDEVTLETADAPVVEFAMSPFEDFLIVLSDPNIAVILLSLGSLGLYFELSAPGSFFPGIAGAIAIVLGLFSLGTLPINYAGLALLLLGLALMGAEIWVASGGVLGVGGAIAFLLGGLLLIDDTQAPFLEVSRPLIYGITLALVLFSMVALRAVMRTRRRPVAIGGMDMVGLTGRMRGPTSIYVDGELWGVRPVEGTSVTSGDPVRVVRREGMTLIVEPLDAASETADNVSKES